MTRHCIGIDASRQSCSRDRCVTNCGHDADWHASDDAMLAQPACWAAELVGLYSRSFSPEKAKRVYQHRDGTSQRRRGCILLLMLVRRAAHATCLQDLPADAPLGARTRRLNHPRHVVSLHVPSRRRRACGDHATSRLGDGRARNERQTGALRRRADAAARLESSSPGSSPRRDRHRARDRRSAAAGRGRVTRSLPHRVSLPALGRSTTRSTVFVK